MKITNFTYYRNKKAETPIDITNTLRLNIRTKKYNDSLVTSASVSHIEADSPFETHVMYQDYNKRVQSIPCKRATDKAIEKAHALAMVNIEQVLIEVKEQYGV